MHPLASLSFLEYFEVHCFSDCDFAFPLHNTFVSKSTEFFEEVPLMSLVVLKGPIIINYTVSSLRAGDFVCVPFCIPSLPCARHEVALKEHKEYALSELVKRGPRIARYWESYQHGSHEPRFRSSIATCGNTDRERWRRLRKFHWAELVRKKSVRMVSWNLRERFNPPFRLR